jgi:hypothetical protein
VGDVIASTSVARLLTDRGFIVDLICAPGCSDAVARSPHVRSITANGIPDIDLDGSYEGAPDKLLVSIPELMIRAASDALEKRGFDRLVANNWANNLVVTDEEKNQMLRLMGPHPRPWIVASPTSHREARTVPGHIFGQARPHIRGTVFWASTRDCPPGLVNLRTNNLRALMAAIALADLSLVVESAPLHITAGLRTPAICFRQSTDPIIRVSLQRDVLSWGRKDLGCIMCGEYVCRVNERNPPCAELNPTDMAQVVNRRVTGLTTNPAEFTVAAVIPVYSPDVDRLNQCIRSVRPHVQQVVLALDGTADIPSGVDLHGVTVCTHKIRARRGYGKTCNRGVLETWTSHILFLNDDCYVEPGAVPAMLAEMKDPGVAVVGCQQWYPDGTIYFGGSQRTRTGFGHVDHKKDKPSINVPVDQEFVNFACALVRRKDFYSVDGFDERYDCYSEDADLCLRLLRHGRKLRYTPFGKAIHEESLSTSTMKQQLIEQGGKIFSSIWGGVLQENQHRDRIIFA